MRLTKKEARKHVAEYLSASFAPSDIESIHKVIDAHRSLKMSVPEPLCAALEIAMTDRVPPGYISRVLMHNGRLRVAVIKRGFEHRFEQMLKESDD